MRITRRQLRRIIKEELLTEINPDPASGTYGTQVHAQRASDSTWSSDDWIGQMEQESEHSTEVADILLKPQIVLGIASIFDPTLTSDSLSAALYAAEGDTETAAEVMLWAGGGLAAGAAIAGLIKGLRSIGKSANEARDIADEVVDATKRIDAPGHPPDPHPEIYRKYDDARQPVLVTGPNGQRVSTLLDEAQHLERMAALIPRHVPNVIGIGGGSSLDVAKYVGFKLQKRKIMIPTTFGSGSEVTRISVLKVNNKKKSFHDDKLFSDISIIDPYFIKNSSEEIIKNSAIDACAQATEAYDSKLTNPYTKLLCEKAFDMLENSILNQKYEQLALGSLICGLGFGNSSTTLGHALSYVYSNEDISHGHALAFTTTVAHKFNNSIFYDRFLKVVKKLQFTKISLKQNIHEASELILLDKKHLDNNPQKVTGKDIEKLLNIINEGF